MLATILETALRFAPLHVEAAEHRRECDCDACVHRAVASEPHPWCALCESSEDVHREPRTLVYCGRPYLGRTLRPWAPLCQTCWSRTRIA